MAQRSLERRNAIGWQLHNERRLILAKHKSTQDAGRQHRHHAAKNIYSEERQARPLGEECSGQQNKYRQSRTTRHKGVYQYGYQATTAALDRACCHNCGHVAAETHNQRDERLSVQARQVHQLIHNKRRASHIARVLHQRDEQVENQDVRQKDRNRSHASDNSIDYQIAQRALRHHRAHDLAQPLEAEFDPLLRICAQREGTPEHNEHQEHKDRNTEVFVRNDAVNERRSLIVIDTTYLIGLGQCALNETILLVRHGTLDILTQIGLDARCRLLASKLPIGIMLSIFQRLNDATIALQHLQRPIARRETFWQLIHVLFHQLRERCNLVFERR